MSENKTMVIVERINGVVMQIMPDGTRQVIKANTDWARLNAMSEEEIEAAAIANSDNPPLNDEQLKKLRRIYK